MAELPGLADLNVTEKARAKQRDKLDFLSRVMHDVLKEMFSLS